MKLLLAAMMLAAVAAPSHAALIGRLDTSPNFDTIVFREMNDGMWLVGAQRNLWTLSRAESGSEVMHVALFWATRLERQQPAYGPSLGFNVGQAFYTIVSPVEAVAATVDAAPPWLKKLSNFTSVDFFAGYRPQGSYDTHHIVYGVGGKVTIPLDLAYAWAKGDPIAGKGL